MLPKKGDAELDQNLPRSLPDCEMQALVTWTVQIIKRAVDDLSSPSSLHAASARRFLRTYEDQLPWSEIVPLSSRAIARALKKYGRQRRLGCRGNPKLADDQGAAIREANSQPAGPV